MRRDVGIAPYEIYRWLIVGADDPVRPNDDRIIFDRADRVVGPYGVSIDGITIHQTVRRGRPYKNKIHDPHILHFSLPRSIIIIY